MFLVTHWSSRRRERLQVILEVNDDWLVERRNETEEVKSSVLKDNEEP